jgi:alpha-L-fucosidase
VAELAKECEKEGIKLCFYYSQAQDWHDPDGYGYGPIPDEQKNFRAYLDRKCIPQLKELLTKYGKIGLIWFDTPQITSPEHSKELKDFVKSIQPECIVSGRIGNRLGEYMSTGDNYIPTAPFDGDWEVPATLNDTWGFKTNDHNWKSPRDILTLLLKINSRGGNYLLNVGPDAKGIIPKESVDILNKAGDFVKKNSDAIYATKAVWGYPYDLGKCFLTAKDHHLYLNFSALENNSLRIAMIRSKVKKATLPATGEVLKFEQHYMKALNRPAITIILPEKLPCEFYNTIDLELEDKDPVFGDLNDL